MSRRDDSISMRQMLDYALKARAMAAGRGREDLDNDDMLQLGADARGGGHRGGNQHVSRSAAVARAKAYRLLGRSAFALGAGISAYQGVQALRRGEYGKAGESGLDIIMGGVGVIGGPIGAGVSGGYFIIDTIGWGNVGRFLVTQLPQGTGFTRAK
jgi:hypothetical protein